MSRHLRALALAATTALSEPDDFLIRWLMLGVENPKRALEVLGKAKLAMMLEDARAIMKREPHTRALMFIGRAIGDHIENGLLGTVDWDSGLPDGPALALGLLIAGAWEVKPAPTNESLRKAWRALPERTASHPARMEQSGRSRRR